MQTAFPTERRRSPSTRHYQEGQRLSEQTIDLPINPTRMLTFTYTNYEGVTYRRTATPHSVRFGTSDWHAEPQWLLVAMDHDKRQLREFAMRDMKDVVYVG
jgi:hypothetical protein